ncbi:MAG: hypothetical protein NW241_10865 [Bacteroidia bacterium]|nr:hypothetical protein [Bacteroidia bacterium]
MIVQTKKKAEISALAQAGRLFRLVREETVWILSGWDGSGWQEQHRFSESEASAYLVSVRDSSRTAVICSDPESLLPAES